MPQRESVALDGLTFQEDETWSRNSIQPLYGQEQPSVADREIVFP